LINFVSDLAKSPIASTVKTGPTAAAEAAADLHPCARAAAAAAHTLVEPCVECMQPNMMMRRGGRDGDGCLLRQ